MEISREHPFLKLFQYFVVLVKMVKSTVPYILLVWSQASQKKIPEIQVQILINHRLWEKHINAWVSISISVTCQHQFCSVEKRLSVPQSEARLLLSLPSLVSVITWQKHRAKKLYLLAWIIGSLRYLSEIRPIISGFFKNESYLRQRLHFSFPRPLLTVYTLKVIKTCNCFFCLSRKSFTAYFFPFPHRPNIRCLLLTILFIGNWKNVFER